MALGKPLLQLEKVTKIYPPSIRALENISFEVRRGELLFVTGPSGAGKSTLLNLIFGLERPSSGRILYGDLDYAHLRRRDLIALRRRMGFIFQDFRLLPEKTVFENVYLGLEVLGIGGAVARERVERILRRLDLAARRDQRVETLSGGEKQRVAIARAVVKEPELVLADEPTGNLDPERSREILRILEELNAEGITVILATHDENLLRGHHRRILVLPEGRIVNA
ncbi:cell division ATP-binding protein FtsE [Thermosulfurimonas marina]|uniref:Cell division ATP-binding protein FtsE n=1 Tax=Thermosulfurimonas marina TaxID=2047767 RepID=A0A6H1WQ57_9BACT|nr:cell division ATP-binding protein FtsE [Thermosulfurimonas marina]QJA05332.1 cell division ATP-binding protein FtsE [Thermosulfurimonas marina]